jgi:hypothetical protein
VSDVDVTAGVDVAGGGVAAGEVLVAGGVGVAVLSRGVESVVVELDAVSGGLEVVSGAVEVVSRGLEVVSGAVDVASGGVDVVSGGVDVVSGGVDVASGGGDVVSGRLDVASGGVEVVAGAAEVVSLVSGAGALVSVVDCVVSVGVAPGPESATAMLAATTYPDEIAAVEASAASTRRRCPAVTTCGRSFTDGRGRLSRSGERYRVNSSNDASRAVTVSCGSTNPATQTKAEGPRETDRVHRGSYSAMSVPRRAINRAPAANHGSDI